MLRIATTLGRSGFQDWLIQRVSAIILAVYSIFIFCYWWFVAANNDTAWQDLFTNQLMKVASLLTLLALISHAWIGIWTVSTDYLKQTYVRLGMQLIVALMLFWYFIWGLHILWG